MGRIKSTQTKRVGKKLFEEHKEKFSADYAENKKVVSKFIETSKKIKNSITGYITKLVKQSK